MITALAAAKAYASAANHGVSAPGAVGGSGGLDFGSMVKSAMNEVSSASHKAETQMVAGVQGKAELIDVATAISAAETSLQTVMAVRDQVISAYQEIMRMPI